MLLYAIALLFALNYDLNYILVNIVYRIS